MLIGELLPLEVGATGSTQVLAHLFLHGLYSINARTLPTSCQQTVWIRNNARSWGHQGGQDWIENCLESKTNFYFWPLPFSSLLPTCMDLSICDSKSFGIHTWQILDTCPCEIQGFGKIKHQKNVTKISQTRSQMRYDISKKGVFSAKMYASRAGGLVGRPDTGASVTYVLPVHVPCSHKTTEQVVSCSCSLKSLRNTPLKIPERCRGAAASYAWNHTHVYTAHSVQFLLLYFQVRWGLGSLKCPSCFSSFFQSIHY